jgi:urease accessory protein
MEPTAASPGCGALLLLTDGRLPAGGHAHSGGLEAAVADGRVRDIDSLAGYLRGRLATVGRVDAHLAAVACAPDAPWGRLEAEAAARSPSPALRAASRSQGRGLLRVASGIWPGPGLEALREVSFGAPMWPVALGSVAAAAGLSPLDAATAAGHGCVSGAAWAAVRLLGLDPFAVTAALAALCPAIDRQAAAAAAVAIAVAVSDSAALRRLPASGGPIVEIAAEGHACWEVRLFAS